MGFLGDFYNGVVYARAVEERTLTFLVSGMLWNRSLVMMDKETESLWSHILGEAMQGELKGAKLEVLPSSMTTWEEWRRDYPQTDVLNLSRTHERFTRAFYSDRDPASFVFGWSIDLEPYSCSFETLQEHPILNLKLGGRPLLVTFDPGSLSPHLFSRRVGDGELRFVAEGEGRMRDEGTGSVWDRSTGQCIEGDLKGRRLEHWVGIVSYRRAWDVFHPDSKTVTDTQDSGDQ